MSFNFRNWLALAAAMGLPIANHEDAADSIIKVGTALQKLSEREQRVLRLRVGLYPIPDDRARTLEEIGAEFYVTRERIRQIEAKALRKLRVELQKTPKPETQ